MSSKFDDFFNDDKQHKLTDTQLSGVMPELTAFEEALSKLKKLKKEMDLIDSQCTFFGKVFWSKLEEVFPESQKEAIADCCTMWDHDDQCLKQNKDYGGPADLLKRLMGGNGPGGVVGGLF